MTASWRCPAGRTRGGGGSKGAIVFARVWRTDSLESQTSTTASIVTGSAEAADVPNGFSPVPPRRARRSRSAAATYSSSETTRSLGRTPTGRSSRRSPTAAHGGTHAARHSHLRREGAVSFCAPPRRAERECAAGAHSRSPCAYVPLAPGHCRLGLGQLRPNGVQSLLELEQRAHLPGDHSKQRVIGHQVQGLSMGIDVRDGEPTALEEPVDAERRWRPRGGTELDAVRHCP